MLLCSFILFENIVLLLQFLYCVELLLLIHNSRKKIFVMVWFEIKHMCNINKNNTPLI